MREPPATLDLATLHAALLDAYGLAADEIVFLPLGYDSSAWVYRARLADQTPRFLKARLGPLNVAGLRVPHLLHAEGVRAVVAPIPTRAGALWATAGEFSLVLYPFVDGPSGMEAGLSDAQWLAYGAALRQIHATPVPPELAATMRRETYTPPGADLLRQADAALLTTAPDDPSAGELVAFWRERRDTIVNLLARAEELGQELVGRPLAQVLCHADIHTGNVLRDGEERVWIVDWDEAVLAPKERDLMFAVGGISGRLVGPREEALFLRGYGAVEINPVALAFYRYAWAVSDIAAFSAEVLFRPDLGAATRAEAVRMLKGLFEPGEIVAIAQGGQGA